MPRFRKRAVEVEAVQWFPGKDVPGVRGDRPGELCPCHRVGGDHGRPHVLTAHGQIVHLSPGDWVVPEPNGEGFYPVKDDIFRANFEPAG